MSLVMEAWEVSKNIVFFSLRAHVLHEYLQGDIKNEEVFDTNVVLPFGIKDVNMIEAERR